MTPSLRVRLDPRIFYEGLSRSDPDRAVLARAAFYFATTGTSLIVVRILLAGSQDRGLCLAISAIGYLIGLIALVGFDRMPRVTYQSLAIGGTALMVTLAFVSGGGLLLTLVLVNFWVALYAVYFLSVREAVAQITLIAVMWTAVFAIKHDPGAAVADALTMAATLALSSLLVILLRRRLRALLGVEQEQYQSLKELDGLKDDFVASVSHELRTPLTSIRGYLELLRDGDAGALNDEQAEYLSIVDRNADRLIRVVNDLLLVATMEAGALQLELDAFDLEVVLNESIRSAAPAAAAKSIELDVRSDQQDTVMGDAPRLSQVLDNLLSNAIKFTPPGGCVSLRSSRANGATVIEVRDTGIGMTEAEQQRLFERFYRTSEATSKAIPGTGLGLAISKAIVEAHTGRISVESEPGRGTMFRIELPLEQAAAPVVMLAP